METRTKEQQIKRLKKAIIDNKFDFDKGDRYWRGLYLRIGPLYCSYGQIGYTIDVEGSRLKWDYEFQELTEQ